MKCNVTLGNIATFPSDVIVNAANSGLWAGSGVCGAIFAEADMATLQAECQTVRDSLGSVPDGRFAVTSSAGIPTCRHIAHAVGPRRPSGLGDFDKAREVLGQCYTRVLDWAYNFDADFLDSVAFPVIGAGVFGWSFEEAFKIAVSAIESFEAEPGQFTATVVVWAGK